MKRSTFSEKSRRLNMTFELLGKGVTQSQITKILMKQFGISSRQASRYIQEAQRMEYSVSVPELTVPVTIKIPRDVALKLRHYAQTSPLTLGEIVAHAVLTFLMSEGYNG
jgi:hypothetical protein